MGDADKQRGNSAKRKHGGKPFQPGNEHAFKPGDPRINRNGRPKSHDELRELIKALASEDVRVKGVTLTRIEAMLIGMFRSRSPADRQQLLEHGYGRVPQDINLSVDDELRKLGVDPDAVERSLAAVITAGASGDDAASSAPSEDSGDNAPG